MAAQPGDEGLLPQWPNGASAIRLVPGRLRAAQPHDPSVRRSLVDEDEAMGFESHPRLAHNPVVTSYRRHADLLVHRPIDRAYGRQRPNRQWGGLRHHARRPEPLRRYHAGRHCAGKEPSVVRFSSTPSFFASISITPPLRIMQMSRILPHTSRMRSKATSLVVFRLDLRWAGGA